MKPIIKESEFRKELKKEPRSGYLFFGDEDYLKVFALKLARETICPDPTYAFFNEMSLDATDFTPDKLLDALMPMPMMADKKLVTVRGLNFTTMRQSDLDQLCDALAQLEEYDYNLLILHVSADCLDPGLLPNQMLFVLEKATGKAVASASLWYGDPFGYKQMRIHWVATHVGHQGKGLCRAMLSRLMKRYHELGMTGNVFLFSQTFSYAAISIYQDFGFERYLGDEPINWHVENFKEAQAQAWQLIDEKIAAYKKNA